MACNEVQTSTEVAGEPLGSFSAMSCTISHFIFDSLYFTIDPKNHDKRAEEFLKSTCLQVSCMHYCP